MGAVSLASGYVDPIARVGAQDEAVYGHSAIAMARGGDWLTPMYLGRFDLHKPPGLLWAGALSLRAFGLSAFALRLPVLLSGLACCLLLFAWVRASRGIVPAAAGLLLVASNPLFHGAARRFTAEAMLAGCVIAALCVLWRDPRLASNRSLAAFGVLTGAAITIKSVGGLLPWLILAAYFATARPEFRPPAKRVAAALGVLILALGAFGSRIAYYLVIPVALLALASALYSPLLRGRVGVAAAAVLACLFAVKALHPGALWALDFRKGTTVRSAPALHQYSLLHRTNELVLVAPDDEFYSSVLDLPRVRYLLIASSFERIPEYMVNLGLVMRAGEFLDLPHATARYAPRLRAWGLTSATPLASVILARSDNELRAVIFASPERDFFLSQELADEPPPTHRLVRAGDRYCVLLAKASSASLSPPSSSSVG